MSEARIDARQIGFCALLCGTAFLATDAMAADGAAGIAFAVPGPILFLIGIVAGAVGAYYYLTRRPASASVSYGADEQKIFAATFQIGTSISVFAALGVGAIFIACLGMGSSGHSIATAFGADLLVAAAAGAVGALFGFIFGIPRTLDPASRAAVASAAAQAGRAAASNAVLGANTNLERVSDWLTTLLIGATLVQIKEVPRWIVALADYLGKGGGITNEKVIPFVAVYFFALGFLGIYLITRLYLTTALTQTLNLLAGGQGVSDITVLRAKLSEALKSSVPEELSAALVFYGHWPLQGDQQADPALNADLAGVLAKYLSTGKADDVTRRFDELKTALKNASADASLKAKLRAGFADKTLTTGDKTKDDDLVKLVT